MGFPSLEHYNSTNRQANIGCCQSHSRGIHTRCAFGRYVAASHKSVLSSNHKKQAATNIPCQSGIGWQLQRPISHELFPTGSVHDRGIPWLGSRFYLVQASATTVAGSQKSTQKRRINLRNASSLPLDV
jgi:hypothetical protein